jgi:hypothetical protein
MNIKDYLHLYISTDTKLICVKEPMVWDENGLKSWLKPGDWLPVSPIILHQLDLYEVFDCFKPLLRPLSDMTEEEAVNVGILPKRHWHEDTPQEQIDWLCNNWNMEIYSPSDLRYLLSEGFDLFGLIDAGLALDKTTYQSPKIQQP